MAAIAKASDVYEGPDTASAQLMDVLIGNVLKFESVTSRLAAADGNEEAAYDLFIKTSDHPQAVKMRAQLEAITAKFRELAEKEVTVEKLTDEQKTALVTEQKTLATELKTNRKVITDISAMLKVDEAGVTAALSLIPDPTKVAGVKVGSTGTTGSSLPRVGANVSVTGGHLTKPHEFENLQGAAKLIGVEVVDVQKALASAAGVDHANLKDSFAKASSVEFTIQPKTDGPTYTLTATAKSRAPKGSGQATAEASTPEAPAEPQESASTEAPAVDPNAA